MKKVALGRAGFEVSPLCLGCMSFGDKASGMHEWTLGPQETETVVAHALEKGINFFDTANVYSAGTSEEYLGRALKKQARREDVIIASKVYFNEGHLKAEAIHREIGGTLKRLDTDYLDLYIIHRFDKDTPMEETLQALHALVQQGKVRALGASAMYGYQFANLQWTAEKLGLTPFISMQNHYNLLYREDERELMPICRAQGVALTPYSPLAAGRLSRASWKSDSLRSRTDATAMGKYDAMEQADSAIVSRVRELAEKHGKSMAQIALSWLWHRGVTAPIVGATKISYLDDAIGALDVALTEEEALYLEEPYVPHKVVGAL